ncbi:hypothetical protein [Blastococcus tunisiensis]|uniref:DUF4126 domain-containing protein n=1 Tax=Blastococcus tunisiensis TaxID=1798228 RepID=A0A1I2IGY7_9ACTN|nr:hypothetical protein [Blastococcus sp. DSM 46838]SFF41662.1 hypothetical protein SAMN05216574_11365 [Blastococcus sp. DSM 46838]
MTRSLPRGLLAGAAGTTALNLVGYVDMALRGRPASDVPERVVDAFAAETGRRVPGSGAVRESRRTALGALAGIANGLGVGVLASAVRSYGVRFPAPVGAVVTGAAAMAATDVPGALLGVSDPRTWTAGDWLADAAPHLAYGAAVQSVLEAVPTPRERATPRGPARPGVVLRSALLGLAAGSRSSLGFAGPVLTASTTAVVRDRDTTRRRVLAGKVLAAAALTGELVADKHPDAPPRDGAGPLAGRILYGAEGGARLAARERENGALPAVVGMAGACVGSVAGLGWRRWAAGRMPPLQAALLEDGVALGLAALACLPGRSRPHLVVVPR